MTNPKGGSVDVVVIGGGIVGCAVARSAARAGLTVIVAERGRSGREATWAAGGMLSPFGEAADPGPFFRLAVESLRRYPDFVRGVEEESGVSVGLLDSGKLELALDEDGETGLRNRLEWLEAADVRLRWLTSAEVLEREPTLTHQVRCGLLLEDEAQVDNRLLGSALAEAARKVGARILEGTPVRKLLREGDRVKGVRTEDGEAIEARRVVVAAGAWSGRIENLPRPLPVRPVRGQMLSLGAAPGTLGIVVARSHTYLIPRAGGEVIVGSTMEEAGFRSRTTARAVAGLLEAALDTAPGLAESPLLESWAGLRPGTPDDLPILGTDPDVEGLVYATGHFRNGILLAPVTAACVTPLLTGEDASPLDLGPFRVERFEERRSTPSGQ